jgi:hypothetical protein
MKIKKDQEEIIINCGVFNYNSQKIANILDLSKKDIDLEMKNKNSYLVKLLQKGRDMADYVIDLKLFELAKTGDLKALDKLNDRMSIR